RGPSIPTPFPYTTLFRSGARGAGPARGAVAGRRGGAAARPRDGRTQRRGQPAEAGRIAAGLSRAANWPVRTPVPAPARHAAAGRSEEHTSELQSRENLVC